MFLDPLVEAKALKRAENVYVVDYPFYTYRWHKVHHVMRPLF